MADMVVATGPLAYWVWHLVVLVRVVRPVDDPPTSKDDPYAPS